MNESMMSKLLAFVFLTILTLSGCTPVLTPISPALTDLPLSTETFFSTEPPTPTSTPESKGTATEQQKSFVIAHSHAEAQNNCKITDAEINDWMEYAKSSDTTGDFSDQVIHWPLVESSDIGGPQAGTHVYWGASEGNNNPGNQFADPNVRPTKRVAFCTINRGDWIETIRLVKYLNPSGRISWWMLRGNGGGDPKRFDDFPVIEWKISSGLVLNDPVTMQLLRDWVATQGESDFPKQLEGKLLYEMN
jgi:hypothetical protein